MDMDPVITMVASYQTRLEPTPNCQARFEPLPKVCHFPSQLSYEGLVPALTRPTWRVLNCHNVEKPEPSGWLGEISSLVLPHDSRSWLSVVVGGTQQSASYTPSRAMWTLRSVTMLEGRRTSAQRY